VNEGGKSGLSRLTKLATLKKSQFVSPPNTSARRGRLPAMCPLRHSPESQGLRPLQIGGS